MPVTPVPVVWPGPRFALVEEGNTVDAEVLDLGGQLLLCPSELSQYPDDIGTRIEM